MTAAGLDPSRIQQRAEILAKAQGAERKRKRDEAESVMDVDGQGEGEGEEGDWMDVDGEEAEGTPKKKQRADSGAVTVKRKRVPASNRQLMGMRDAAVSLTLSSPTQMGVALSLFAYSDIIFHSKLPKPSNCGIFPKGSVIALRRQARVTAPSKPKWFVVFLYVPCSFTAV